MVLAEDLRQAVLQAALQGKLTEQLETDSDVDEMLIGIQEEKNRLIADKKIKKEKPLPEIQEEDIPFDIPDNWRWVRLQTFLDIRDGTHDSPKYVECGIPFVTSKNLNNGKIDFSDIKYITKEDADIINVRSKVDKHDILMAMIGSIGKPVLVDIEKEFVIKNMALFKKVPNSDVDMHYVLLLLNYAENIMKDQSTGGVQKFVSLTYLRQFISPLPPIEEQQRIVDKINKIMPKIDEYEEIEKELEELKREFSTNMKDALLQAAMQGKLTEQLESDSSVEGLVREEDINPLDEEDYPYSIPDNWKFAELGELTSIPIKRGKSPKYVDKSGTLVFAQKCNQKIGKISLDDAKYLDENIKHKYEQDNFLQGNDIVINSTGGGTLGRIGYISESLIKHSLPIVPDSHITTIRTKDNVSSRYIYFFLKYNQPYLETMGVGSTNQTELRPDTIKELIVPLPPIEEQQRIVERLDALLPLCDELKEE